MTNPATPTPTDLPEALPTPVLDFSLPLETYAGEPVKYVCHDVIEHKCARLSVDAMTGRVYSSPYIGLMIRNRAAPTAPQAQQPTAPQGGAPADDEDGAAFRKAARLGLTLRFYGNCAQSGMPGSPSAYEVMPGEDRVAAMREAVKRAAAVIESGGEAQRLEQSPQAGAENYPPSDPLLAAHTDLLTYVLQGDVHNRLTPRVIDIAYTAFMQAKRPNTEDGGPSDWFNDTKPMIEGAIDKLRRDLMQDRSERSATPAAVSAPSVGDALAPLRAWWAMHEAQWELCEETPSDDVIILHFMGSGASSAVTAGQLRAALSNTASPQAPAGEGGAS